MQTFPYFELLSKCQGFESFLYDVKEEILEMFIKYLYREICKQLKPPFRNCNTKLLEDSTHLRLDVRSF